MSQEMDFDQLDMELAVAFNAVKNYLGGSVIDETCAMSAHAMGKIALARIELRRQRLAEEAEAHTTRVYQKPKVVLPPKGKV